MSIANFGALFSRLKYGDSPSFQTYQYEPPSAMSPNSMQSSASSQNSVETVIRRLPGNEEVHKSQTSTVNGGTETTTKKTTKVVKSVHSKQDVIVHPPNLVLLDSDRGKGTGINGVEEQVETHETITFSKSHTDGPVASSKGPSPSRGHNDTNRLSNNLPGEAKLAESPPEASAMAYTSMRPSRPAAVGTTQRKSRETTIDDPYYPPIDPHRGSANPARHSWHEIRPNNLGDMPLVQAQPRKALKETLIDFPSPAEHPGMYQKNISSHTSRPLPSPRSRSQENGRRYDVMPSTEYEQQTPVRREQISAKDRQDQSLGAIAGDNSAMQRETAHPAYALIHKGNERSTQAISEATMREREDMLRKTRSDVQRTSYPGKGRPQYADTTTTVVTRQEARNGIADRNEFTATEQMRGNKSPILVRVQIGKNTSNEASGGGQYNASDYGDDWGEETTIIRKVDMTKPRPQLIEERYRTHHYRGYKKEEQAKERQQQAAPPPYVPHSSPVPTAPAPTAASAEGDSDVEYAVGETRLLKDGQEQGTRMTTKKKTTKTTT
ncbi:unnamed protein product [Strongylus vulgaris]|uniref:Uncharacterized protein n=1 Tax=Strongylus vulgaris TaxID=40348 RepID=A0A3P7L6X9_STRVU|nr:unnamed protein product [Strongylus vulgaris]